ncbi:MAG: amidase [Kiloniellales bacterium]|nr:amidase [Kiloniellales bacterium]
MDLIRESGVSLRGKLAAGEITAEALVQAYLARIDEVDGEIGAWAHLDPDHALAQARTLDQLRGRGLPLGPLHGLPVAVKDIVDTADLPTENGSALLRGRRPETDATLVSLLRQAGAVVLGKSVTTEFAMYAPGKTANPHHLKHTPGGSSSGSAAAVAAGMAPLAIASQTNGSVIRPASFCGVVGFKPSHGRISRHGVLTLSRPLDTMGVMATTVEDAALLAEVLMAYDSSDRDMRPLPAPGLLDVAREAPPLPPRFAFVKTPVWEQAEDDMTAALSELADHLGADCERVDLPALYDRALPSHRSIMCADLAKNLQPYYERGREGISPQLAALIEEGRSVTAIDYNRALEWREVLYDGLAEIFENFDAILTAPAPGEAPSGLEATGNPAFCTMWTFLGTPAVSLPVFTGSSGLPMGVQLVGPRSEDARLLRSASALLALLRDGGTA